MVDAINPEKVTKETLNGDFSAVHVLVLCGDDVGRYWHRGMVLQEKEGE
jgi:hypothetical protein